MRTHSIVLNANRGHKGNGRRGAFIEFAEGVLKGGDNIERGGGGQGGICRYIDLAGRAGDGFGGLKRLGHDSQGITVGIEGGGLKHIGRRGRLWRSRYLWRGV